MRYLVTIFKSVKDVSNPMDKDLLHVLERIRTGDKSKEAIEQIRSIDDKDKQNQLKKSLIGVCFNGTFNYRSSAGLKKHSGLIVLDIDNFDTMNDAKLFKDILKLDKYVFACWLSPSGKGVKILIRIPADATKHEKYFKALKQHFNTPNWDDSGKDVARFCYESYDPDLYFNPDASLWIEEYEPEAHELHVESPIIPLTDSNEIVNRLMNWFNKKFGSTKGSRNNNLYKLAIAMNDFGISKVSCESFLSPFQEDGFPMSEIKDIVNSAYKNLVTSPKQFDDTKTIETVERLIRSGKKNSFISNALKDRFDEDEVEVIIDKIKENLVIDKFWTYDENNKINLSIYKYKVWLEQNNFLKYFPDPSKPEFLFIKVKENLLSVTSNMAIKDFINDFLETLPDEGLYPFEYMNRTPWHFENKFLSMLRTTEIQLLKDTKTNSYLYYNNCVVKVDKNSVEKMDYIDVDGFIWKETVIDRDFERFNDGKDSEFKQLLFIQSNKDQQRFESLKSVIGFLLHTYKDSNSNRAIILNDEHISDNPNGGSGKGLICKAISHIRKTTVIPGKGFDHKNTFKFAQVNIGDQIIQLDDIERKFDFEDFFPLITEGITIRKMNQNPFTLPVEDTPKILITTNYTVKGEGGSHQRRKHEVEISQFFNEKNTPEMFFGHLLFNDWDRNEWLRFDNFMIECLQFYLKNGLIKHDFVNLKDKKYYVATSPEWIEFSSDKMNIPLNERIYKRDLYQKFINDYPEQKKYVTPRKISKYITEFANYYKFEVTEGKAHDRWVMFTDIHGNDNRENIENPENDIPF